MGSYEPRDRALSLPEYRALYLALPADRRPYLVGFCGLGARDSELHGIEAHDLDPQHGTVRLRGAKTKGSDRWLHPPRQRVRPAARQSRRGRAGPTVVRALAEQAACPSRGVQAGRHCPREPKRLAPDLCHLAGGSGRPGGRRGVPARAQQQHDGAARLQQGRHRCEARRHGQAAAAHPGGL